MASIQIHNIDKNENPKSKDKYFIRVVRGSRTTGGDMGFNSEDAVIKNIVSNSKTYESKYAHLSPRSLFRMLNVQDHTIEQKFVKKGADPKPPKKKK